MPLIKSISDLRNHSGEISNLCHESGEPVFVTKNGEGDLVVMSQALYEKQVALLELYFKLGEAEDDSKAGDKGISHREMIKRLKSRL